MSRLVEMTDICKSYDGSKNVLEELNFSIDEGEFAAIYGASGCGKSTFLNIVGLLDNCTSGDYFFNGCKISKDRLNKYQQIRAADIGFVFQSYCLIDSISVFDNILMPLMYVENKSVHSLLTKADSILDDLNILHLKNQKAITLSGGERQRVAIARAIIKEPKLIIADEPTGNLDDANANLVISAFRNIVEKGTSIIVVTHNRHLQFGNGQIYTLRQGALYNDKME